MYSVDLYTLIEQNLMLTFLFMLKMLGFKSVISGEKMPKTTPPCGPSHEYGVLRHTEDVYAVNLCL